MSWYKKSQLNMGASTETTKLAASISTILIEADKGRIITDTAIYNIMSTIPSVPILEQAIEIALKMAAGVSGIVDTTPAREDVIQRINNMFMSDQTNQTEVNNGMAQENIIGNSEAQQVQQEV